MRTDEIETNYEGRYISVGPNIALDFPFKYSAWVWHDGWREFLIGGNSAMQALSNAKKAIDNKFWKKWTGIDKYIFSEN